MLLGNFSEVGGRQIHQDDLQILQDELLKAIQLQYVGQGAFILQGCSVTGTAGNYSIGGGLVFIDGNVMEFNAVTGITSFPKYIAQAEDIQLDSYPLEQGGSAYKRTLIKAELVNSAPISGEFIVMSASGGRNYNDVLASQFVRLSGNQTVNGQKSFTSDVISNGVNVNAELSNLGSIAGTKANKTVTVSGGGGLAGGGDLSASRVISIADGGVGSNQLSDGGVSTAKLADGSVTITKLGTDTIDALTGNNFVDDSYVDFTNYSLASSKTYSSKAFTFTHNVSKARPYVRMQIQAASGDVDNMRLQLQRSNNPSSGFSTIAERVYRLSDNTFQTCIIEKVDNGAFVGTNYYRLVATNLSDGTCQLSNSFSATIFSVTIS